MASCAINCLLAAILQALIERDGGLDGEAQIPLHHPLPRPASLKNRTSPGSIQTPVNIEIGQAIHRIRSWLQDPKMGGPRIWRIQIWRPWPRVWPLTLNVPPSDRVEG